MVGITKFCIHPPEWFQQKKRVGGTKTVDFGKVAALSPDLIIGNKEENEEAQIRALETRFPVWMSDVQDLPDACAMIRSIGALTGTGARAETLAIQGEKNFTELRALLPPNRIRAAYFIWRKPYMVAAGQTFVDAMLREAGFDNVFSTLNRYPEVTMEMVAARKPEVLLLSSEPFPFSEKHFGPFQAAMPGIPVVVVDGELFSWYGSRLLQAPAYFRKLRESLILADSGHNIHGGAPNNGGF